MAAGAGVVEEDGAWAEEKASTPVGNENSTNTAALTNRESVQNCDLSRPVDPYCNDKHDCCPGRSVVVALNSRLTSQSWQRMLHFLISISDQLSCFSQFMCTNLL